MAAPGPFLYVIALCMATLPTNVVACSTTTTTPYTPLSTNYRNTGTSRPDNSACGHSRYYSNSDTPGSAISDGSSWKSRDRFPWVARIQILSKAIRCAASIIDGNYLLTAASCIRDAVGSPSDAQIHFADDDTQEQEEAEFSRNAAEIMLHPNYDADTYAYDFALIWLPESLNFSDWDVQPICLPENCSDGCAAGTGAEIVGWGATAGPKGGYSRYLRTGDVYITEQSICQSMYPFIGSTTICAASPSYIVSGSYDSCVGDGGGPLMTVERGYYQVCGLINLVSGCGTEDYGGYSRVCYGLDWIHEVLARATPSTVPTTSTTAATATTGSLTTGPSTTVQSATEAPIPPSECGHSMYHHGSNEPGVGIIGGSPTRVNEYPWIVVLHVSDDYSSDNSNYPSWKLECAATIISEYYLLTAASCLRDSPQYVVALFGYAVGSYQFSLASTEYTIHPNYDHITNDYDFALVRLPRIVSSFMDFTTRWSIQKVCLPVSCADNCREHAEAYIAGWGTTQADSNWDGSFTHLRHAKVPIQNFTVCNEQFGGRLTDRMLCAGYLEGGVDTCYGDTGGPLMTIENGAYTQCGVTSFGYGCAEANSFGVYSSVCSEIDWIKRTAGIP